MSTSSSPPCTQFTMKTSTPLRGNVAHFSSPSASPCSSAGAPSSSQKTAPIVLNPTIYYARSDSLSSSNASYSVSRSFAIDEDDDDGQEEVLSKSRRRMVKKSKDFLEFQPKREEGLYKKLIGDGPDICDETVAKDWLLSIEMRPLVALQNIIEYFLDLCGFQHIDIKKLYQNLDVQFETVVKIVESNISTSHTNGKYLMRAKTTYATSVIKNTYSFLKYLVLNDTNFALFLVNRPNNVFRFVSVMCNSQYRPILHTGALIAIKLNSAYCQLSYQLNTSANVSQNTRGDEKTINAIQRYLWNVIKHVCHINDRFFEPLRTECAKEMWIWFKKRPEFFLESEEHLTDFLKFCLDTLPKVRLAALETCDKLISSPQQLYGYLKPFTNRIVNEITERITDIDANVAAKAVDCCTTLLNTIGIDKIPSERITTLIFSKHYQLAAASGRFFINLLRHNSHTKTHYDIVKRLIYVCRKLSTNDNRKVALLVEAIIDSTPELQNWTAMINSLVELTDNTNYHDGRVLLAIFCQTAMQTLTGRCEVVREKARCGVVRKSVTKTIVTVFVPYFHRLIDLYGKRKEDVLLLVKTLNAMDFAYLNETEENKKYTTFVYNCLGHLFKHATDVDIAQISLKTLKTFCSPDNHFHQRANDFYQIIQNQLLERLQKTTTNADPQLKNVWLQLAAAMEVAEIHKRIHWKQIFNDQFKQNVECLKYQLMACKWFIYQKTQAYLQNYLADQNNNITLDELREEIQEFANYLFNLLLADVEEVAVVAFKRICETKVLINELLKEPIKTNENLSVLHVPNMSRDDVITCFYRILEKNIVETTSPFDLETRKQYLHYALHLCVKEEPFKHLNKIIRFYAKYYEEFGAIFDQLLNQLKTDAPLKFTVLIYQTLLYEFSETYFDMENLLQSMKHATELKQLVKQLVRTCVKTTGAALNIVQFCIKHITKNLDQLHFFFVLTYFVERLGVDDCLVLYENLKTKIPENHHNNPGFLNFMVTLKAQFRKSEKKTTRRTRKKKVQVDEEESTTTQEEIYTIEDSDSD